MGILSSSSREIAIQQAREFLERKPVFLDTETTGLSQNDEIVEIAILDFDGRVLLEELVKPKKTIPADAFAIHGIDNLMVSSARSWPILWPHVREVIFGRVIGIYNVSFDLRMMRQSFEVYKIPWKETLNTFDILDLFTRFYGEWDSFRKAYRFQSLEKAGRFFRIPLENSHRAKDDALLALEVLQSIASYQA